jgi:drug/metabolite transporter (DMT)-like permease
VPQSDAGAFAQYLGPVAGFGTAVLWVLTSLFFTSAGRRIGATAVNTIRIAFAVVLYTVSHALTFGTLAPDIHEQRQWVALAFSGVLGLTICDQALFTSFLDIGPRRALLCMTTSPIFALFLGALFLGERVTVQAAVGILLTLGGVAWVVAERGGSGGGSGRLGRGIILAVVAAASQAVGGMLSKFGMGIGWLPEGSRLDPQSAAYVRMVFGLFGMAPMVLILTALQRRKDRADRPAKQWGPGVGLTACGAVVGPFLGMWCSLIAFKHSPLAIAQTLMSLSPVLILPIAYFGFRERVSRRAVIGALVAIAGAALLAFSTGPDPIVQIPAATEAPEPL